ncbi:MULTISPECIES: diacylglycerol kinase [Exiguobacterium]|uniref:diacylglycerol kinase n=1 Tax=Exiguobacterium TaxID=33986 RepID=UPI0008778B87|nr:MULTISPECIES: diacylglycerol kinase [Exiguobacterium]TCI27207.1 diacylglycerol kinase [Exiguobacterium sp. SH5S4]TCI51219.1 diacylglycerol kinase [Exiguobacterium sp. SH5S13]TCI62997.1 diacylglycerol kinase [Exiguobacterium sp. SH0S2]TCI63937.1 diacylglycerol kinase [Exiguobacterium sp. SH3S1]TCI77724.1 diacylglycerol kinase [Exiguobacterium sp. SH0S1]
MQRKRARVIYNPTSGKEVIKRELPYILNRLEDAGYETSTYATKAIGDATLEAERAAAAEFDLIVAAGGDGTLNEVISGLAPLDERPTIGLIPVGTTNDFARAMRIPLSVVGALDVICDGFEMPVDLGEIEGEAGDIHYFINIAGGGIMTELSYEVPSKLKTALGQLAYYVKGMEKLPLIKPTYIELEHDEGTFSGEVMIFLTSNSNSVGGFEKISPHASLNDGLFDLFILRKCNLFEFIHVVRLLLRGEHLSSPLVEHVKTGHVKMKTTTERMSLNIDGEYGGECTGEMRNLFRHLTVLAPNARIREMEELNAQYEREQMIKQLFNVSNEKAE